MSKEQCLNDRVSSDIHIAVNHKRLDSFVYEKCEESFDTSHDLEWHLATHHEINQEET